MTCTVYKKTATKANNGKVFAFGRETDYIYLKPELGEYALFRLASNYNGQMKGGIDKHWVAVKRHMTFEEAKSLMNVKCGYKAFD